MVLVGVVKMVKVWQKIQNMKRYTEVFVRTDTVYFQEVHRYKFEVNQISSSLDFTHTYT